MEDNVDWTKLNMKEVNYYCTSFDIDFDCLPVSDQIKQLIGIFYYYDITQFTIDDIQEFYRKMKLRNARSGKIVHPSPAQIRKIIEKLNTVQYTSENCYTILCASERTEWYSSNIKQAYEKSRIQ